MQDTAILDAPNQTVPVLTGEDAPWGTKPLFLDIDSLPRALGHRVDLEMERMNWAPLENGRIRRMISPEKLPRDSEKKAEEKRRYFAWLLEEMAKMHKQLWHKTHENINALKKALPQALRDLDRQIPRIKDPLARQKANNDRNALQNLMDELPEYEDALNNSHPGNMKTLEAINNKIEWAKKRFKTLGTAFDAVKNGTSGAFKATSHAAHAGATGIKAAGQKLGFRHRRRERGNSSDSTNAAHYDTYEDGPA